MDKEKVKHLSGVFASVFAHAGHITKEEAKEISGLADHEFQKAYDSASITSLKKSCSMKARRWISSWSILPKRLKSTQSIMAENYLNRFAAGKASCFLYNQ
jgi:hypothetical protein